MSKTTRMRFFLHHSTSLTASTKCARKNTITSGASWRGRTAGKNLDGVAAAAQVFRGNRAAPFVAAAVGFGQQERRSCFCLLSDVWSGPIWKCRLRPRCFRFPDRSGKSRPCQRFSRSFSSTRNSLRAFSSRLRCSTICAFRTVARRPASDARSLRSAQLERRERAANPILVQRGTLSPDPIPFRSPRRSARSRDATSVAS